jgi:hypothetical protein
VLNPAVGEAPAVRAILERETAESSFVTPSGSSVPGRHGSDEKYLSMILASRMGSQRPSGS